MFIITKQLKAHMVASFGLSADADEATTRAAVEKAMEEEKLTYKQVKELTASGEAAENRVRSIVVEEVGKAVGPAVTAAMAPVNESLKSISDMLKAKGGDGAALTPATPAAAVPAAIPAAQPVEAAKALGTPAATAAAPAAQPGEAAKAFAAAAIGSQQLGNSNEVEIRVKGVEERFADTRTALTYASSRNEMFAKTMGHRQVTTGEGDGAYGIDVPTYRSKAVAGAWFKLLATKAYKSQGKQVPWQFRMTEQDRQLCEYAVHKSAFVGPVGYRGGDGDSNDADAWFSNEKIFSDVHRKALLDDSTSGGLEAVPIEFDALAILTPLLNGELFPLVNIRNVTRRRIEAAKISNPSMSWGVNEGTPISLFDTDSFISAFDNNIYPITGAMELGNDFLSDSPIDIAGIVQERYGQVFLKEMDNVIVYGNGTSQPEGVFVASGTTTNSNAGGAGAAPQVGDYEGLMHTVSKAYLQEAGFPPNSRAVFIGTQTTYRRARAIAVNTAAPTTDARRIFGQDNQFDYSLMGFKYAIGQHSSLTNAIFGFFCMNRYRMYRRQGLEVKVVTDDRESVRRNTQLIVLRARFGGALDQGAAGVKIVDAQA